VRFAHRLPCALLLFEGDAEAKPGRDRAAGMRSHILALFDMMNKEIADSVWIASLRSERSDEAIQ
jgi:hypothetical protein